MMRGRVGIVLALAVLWLSGCATTPPGVPYDSAGNEAAQGLHLRVYYPEGWIKEAGDNKNMLAKFSRKQDGLVEMLMLQVYEVDESTVPGFFDVPDAMSQEMRHTMWRKSIGSLPDSKVFSVTDRKMADGRHAVLVDASILPEKFSQMIYTRMYQLHVYEPGWMVTVSCATGGVRAQVAEVDALLKQNSEPVCEPYFASLRFMDKTGDN